jgi:3-oxoacyl-[acyl-carrier-protein] synthase II
MPAVTDHRGRRRVVVTGLGAITPVGLNVEDYWASMLAGRSGVGRITAFDPSGFACQLAAEVHGFDPLDYVDAKEARRLARFSQFAVAASRQALEDAGLRMTPDLSLETGVLLGTAVGAFDAIERESQVLFTRGGSRVSPFFVPTMLPNMPAGQVSRLFGLKGYNSTVVTACAASAQAIGEAAEVIRRGDALVMLAGGTEGSICALGLAGFATMRALSSRNDEPQRASRPFDAQRDGFVPGEGCAILVLEDLEHALRRDARILAELVGYGVSADAYHVTAPEPDGDGPMRAFQRALRDAALTPHAVDYVSAHATSTPLGDTAETIALKRVLGERAYRVPVSAPKSIIGHLLGAAGAVESLACVLAIRDQKIHPTINYEYPDPTCDLDYVPNVARAHPVRVAVNNSFGFGGQNTTLIFRQFEG